MLKFWIRRYNSLSIAAKASIVYIFANFFTKGLSIITTPIFTRIMSVEEIGVVNNFAAWNAILYVIATLSLSSGGFSVAMMDYKDRRDQYQSSVLTLSTISVLIFSALIVLFRIQIKILTGLDDILLFVMILNFLFYPAVDFWLQRSRYELKYRNVAFLTTVQTLLSAVASIGFVLIWAKTDNSNLGDARLVGQFVITIGFAIVIYIKTMTKGKTLFQREFWKFALCVNLPLVFHSLAKYILDISDRTMITKLIGLREVGIYGTLYNVSSLSLIIWNSINAALIPIIFERLRTNRTKKINGVILPLIYVYAIVCIVLTLVSPEIVKILTTHEYYEAIYLMPPVAAGIFMTCVYNIYSNILMYYKKTIWIMISTVIVAIINVILNLIFIPRYGFIAASYTTLIAYLLLALFQWFMQRIISKEQIYEDKKIWCTSSVTILVCLFCNMLYGNTFLRYTIILIVGIILFFCRKQVLAIIISLKNKEQNE